MARPAPRDFSDSLGDALTQPPSTTSFLGYNWQQQPVNSQFGLALSQRYGLMPQLANVLAGRIEDLDAAELFLHPSLRIQLGNPNSLRDMDRAIARTIQALQNNEPLAVWGDYDVDGATSSALLTLFFRSLGHEPRIHIPDRIDEGYGPNAAGLTELYNAGCRLVFVVDSGTLAFEPLAAAKAIGLDVIVLDHHQAKPELPPAYAVINPNRLDDDSGYNTLAAVGVSFLFLVALVRAMKAAGWDAEQLPDLLQWLDVVALGTVCDVMPLRGLNRALVAQGLKVMRRSANPGLRALAASANLTKIPSAHSCGFVLGPRINAGGRVGQADLGARLLTSQTDAQANELAAELDRLNLERRQLEQAATAQALAWVEEQEVQKGAAADSVLVVAHADWHPGIIGLISSRLVEIYQRPAVAFSLSAHPAKGSGRSIQGFDLGGAVLAARAAGLLVDGGGHAMAAGMAIANQDPGAEIEALKQFFQQRLAAIEPGTLARTTRYFDDYIGSLAWQDPQFMAQLQQLAPFGEGNPSPKFCLNHLEIIAVNEPTTGLVQAMFKDQNGKWLKANLSRRLASRQDELMALRGQPLSAIVTFQLSDTPRGMRAYLSFEDVMADPHPLIPSDF
ncbi:MAG: single-stranded-DNA-specific exonuclease RecJ [Holosporaceae bacterium]|jgi:single-stranded-DNA-specific exonuclease